jgi:hypothetical protein
MAKTMYDMGLWSPQESWRAIRNLRAAPPDSLASVLVRDRADVFHMALEQSEQLFGAAAEVARESRPLLLFYGLGQAGRALAAASDALNGAEWQANGHGLKPNVAELRPSAIWSLRTSVRPDQQDLFSRASAALGSATDIGEVTIGAATANLLEFVFEFPDFREFPRILTLGPVSAQSATSVDPVLKPTRFPVRVESEEDLETFLGSVPLLARFAFWRDSNQVPQRDHNGHVLVAVPMAELDLEGQQAKLRGRQSYRGQDVAVRALGNSSNVVHPLMVWWLVLYPLSMLARYEPRKWQQVLDVRASASWSQIEFICDRALDAVPQLLADALIKLNGGDHRGES